MKSALIFLTGVVLGMVYTYAVYQIPTEMSAYDICTSARQELDGASEQRCADALDKEQSIFMCNKAGTVCWTERI